MATLTKYAVRFFYLGSVRTYIVRDLGKSDAICSALDYLEHDIPATADTSGLALIVKAWPDGLQLAYENDGPVIDTTRGDNVAVPSREPIAA